MHSRTARAQEQRRMRCGVLSLRGMLMLPPSRGCRRRRSAAGGRTSCCFAASRLLSRWRWAPSPSHSSAGSRTSSSRASRSTLSTSRSQPSSLEALACPGSSTDCTGQLAARSLSSPPLSSPLLSSPRLATPLLSSPLLSSHPVRTALPLARVGAVDFWASGLLLLLAGAAAAGCPRLCARALRLRGASSAGDDGSGGRSGRELSGSLLGACL